MADQETPGERPSSAPRAPARRGTSAVIAIIAVLAVVAVVLAGLVGVHAAGHGSSASAPSHSTPAVHTVPAEPTSTPSRTVAGTVASLPMGAPPKIPYLITHGRWTNRGFVGSTIFRAGGRTYHYRGQGPGWVVTAGDTVLISNDSSTWKTLRNGRFVRVPYLQGQAPPELNGDGTRLLTESRPAPRVERMSIYDTATGVELGHVDTPTSEMARPLMNRLGTVIYWSSQPDRDRPVQVTMWRVGSEPVRLRLPQARVYGGLLVGIIPAGPVLQTYATQQRVKATLLLTANADGSVMETPIDWPQGPTVYDEISMATSPDGSLVTWTDGTLRPIDPAHGGSKHPPYKVHRVAPPSVRNLVTGQVTQLGLPTDTIGARFIAFEDATHVLLTTRDVSSPKSTTWVVRCPVDGSACERAGGPDASDWEFPSGGSVPADPDGIYDDSNEAH